MLIKRALLFFLLAVAVTACASGSFQQTNFEVRESYRSPAFQDIFKGQAVALLTAANSEDRYEYRKLLGDFVEESIKKLRPDIQIVPYWQTLSVINSEGYTADYSEMLKQYAHTGILDKKVLNKLGSALAASYFLQPRLINFEQSQSTRFGLFGLTLFKTHESRIKIYFELWNAKNGEIVWIGVAETNMASERFKAKPIPFEEVARFAIEELVKKIP